MRSHHPRWIWLVLSSVSALLGPARQSCAQAAEGDTYAGMAEASAAVSLDDRHFVVAEDECNTLLVFARGEPNPVGPPIDVASFLKTEDKASDIEAGARVGELVYWISSHSLPKSGTPRQWRKQFFAMKVRKSDKPPTLEAHGSPYTGLLDDMIADNKLKNLRLGDAATILPEQDGGLNIEGLAAWKRGGLLIGFRSPLVASKAPVVPLRNPAAVIQGHRAKFDKPILLDLGGRGIRSIDRIGSYYLIVAGPVGDAGTFALYRWSGESSKAPRFEFDLPAGFSPEALIPAPGSKGVDLLSDDGSSQPGASCGSAAKAHQSFRTLRIYLP